MDSEMDSYRRMAAEVLEGLERSLPRQNAPHEYSEESRRLSRQLAEKIKQKLETEGKTLIQDPETGRYRIVQPLRAQRRRRSQYSEQSQVLAQRLADKAKRNLERSGWTVTQDPETGRYTATRPSASALAAQRAPVRRSFWDWLLRR